MADPARSEKGKKKLRKFSVNEGSRKLLLRLRVIGEISEVATERSKTLLDLLR